MNPESPNPSRLRSGLALAVSALTLFALTGCSQDAPSAAAAPEVQQSHQKLTPGCGNGVLEPELGETCDDGNITGGDGCTGTCTIESGFVCVGERPSTCTAPDQSDAPASFGSAQHSRSLPPVSPFVGQDFWTAFPHNIDTPTALALKIAGDPGTTGTVKDYAGTQIASFTLPASGVVTVQPTIATYHITSNNTVTHQGVHITATGEVRVLATNEATYTTDTWGVWATEKLGLEYRVLDAASSSFGWEFVVVGTAANTAVTVKNTAGTVMATFTLNAGDIYQYASNSTMVGWTVSATEPVALISGTQCTNDVGSACDMTAEQIAPTRNWARDYVVAPTFNSTTAKFNHVVVASENNTTVIITDQNGVQQTHTLNAGQSYFFATGSTSQLGYFVTGDKPIAVVSNIGDPGHIWDPSLVTWPPLDGYVSSAKMPTSGVTLTYTNFLTVITRTSATSNITVNGAAVTGWTAISTTGYSYARVSVPNGDNTVAGANGVKFAAVASGGNQAVSYGYASPYDIATVGGTTTCYLGTNPPDYEAAFSGSAAADQDDTSSSDDEDAFAAPTSVQHGATTVTLNVPCNDNYFGVDVTANVSGFIDFNLDGTFGADEVATAGCVDNSPFTDGVATLTWNNPTYAGLGNALARLRICDSASTCTSATGAVASGEVEDHLVHIGTCGDGFVDTFDACDDGNTSDLDGCSATCTVESGFVCSGNPSVCLLNQAPAIQSPADGTLLTTATPAVSGTCVDGATVRVRDGNTVLCTATCASGAFSCTSSSLADGSHALIADQQIGSSLSVASPQVVVKVDTVAPSAPAISSPPSGTATSDKTPDVAGSCEPGASVQVKSDGTSVCTATCALNGSFACTTSALADGAHSLTAVQTDVGGNVSPASGATSVVVDTAAPVAPTITSPSEGVDPGTAFPQVSGTCESGATVKVVENLTTVLCTTSCAAGGTYTCTTTALAIGSHTIQARQFDAAGNPSPFSAQRTFPISTPATSTPTFSAPAEGAILGSASVTVTVGCTTGDDVTVSENGASVCTGTCAANTLSCTVTFSDGAHALTAVQVENGTSSLVSAPRNFTVDTTAPAAPAFTSPADGSVTNVTTQTVSGTCESGATVTVSEGANALCTANCDAQGAFSCTTPALSEGVHSLTAQQVDPAGNQGSASTVLSLTVDLTAPAAPVIQTPAEQTRTNDQTPVITGSCEPAATVQVLEGALELCTASCDANGAFECAIVSALPEGSHALSSTQTDPAGNTSAASAIRDVIIDLTPPAAPAISAPVEGAFLSDATPEVSGTCESEAQVEVSEDGTVLCSATCAGGTFTCASSALADGPQGLTATQTDVAGNAGPASAVVAFTVDTQPPSAPGISTPAAGTITNITATSVSGSCEPGATVDVLEGATLLCTTTCSAGSYTCQLAPMTEGAHTLAVHQADAAGNVSPEADVSYTIDITPPAAPVVLAPTEGQYTNDNTPAISGTCESDATVAVSEGAAVLCSAVCVSGTFSCEATQLADGQHVLSAVQTDVAGNLGAASSARSFIVDTQVAAPGIAAPAEGAFLSTTTPAVSGSCESGATVTVSEGATTLCTANCDAQGAYACTSSALPEGSHTLSVSQVDLAQNASTSTSVTVTLDVTAPAAPAIASPADGAFLQAQSTEISGSCESDATVEVLEDGTVLCSATCTAGTFTCTTPTLPEGEHHLVTHQTDRAGNLGADSAPTQVTFDVTAPAAPVASTPVDGSGTADATPAVAGSCEPFATVTVSEGSTVLCTATCDEQGAFTCDASALSDGAHSLSLTQTDRAGNESAASTLGFTVDTTAPVIPTVTAPAADALLSTAQPVVSGTGEPGSTTHVWVDGVEICTTQVAADGTWSCTPAGLSDGEHHLQVSGEDPLGNTSALSSAPVFTVDTTAPQRPSILLPTANEIVSESTSFSGRGEPGSTVSVSVDGTVVCSATVDAAGAWACMAAPPLATGSHQATATAQDEAGNSSQPSDALSFSVSADAAPGAPVITQPVAGGISDSSTPEVRGHAEPGATVEVKVDGLVVCTTTADASGDFSCVSSVSLPDGAHQVTATAADAHGTSQTAGPAAFGIDTTAPDAPVLSTPADGSTVDERPLFSGTAEAGSTVTVTVDGTIVCTAMADAQGQFACSAADAFLPGAHSATAQAKDEAGHSSADSAAVGFTVQPGAAPAPPSITAPVAGAQLTGGTVVFAGHAGPGTTVTVMVDGSEACTAVAGPSGDWVCSATGIGDGAHTATATASSEIGTSAASMGTTFTVDQQGPAAPVVTAPAQGATTNAWPQFAGTAEPGSVVRVQVDGREVCVAVADASGSFACSAPVPLAEGAHQVTATAQDAAGWASPESAAVAFTVSLHEPVLSQPEQGSSLGDNTPEFSGTAEPGNTVRVVVDGEVVCTTVADENGDWSCTPSEPLTDGAKEVQVKADDGFGTVKTTESRQFVVDTVAPDAPVVSQPANGEELLGGTVTFSGTSEPGSVVDVKVDGQTVCTAVADETGHWTCEATGIPGGEHQVTTTAKDAAGNVSNASAGSGFLNRTALPAPEIQTPASDERVNGPQVTFSGKGIAHTTVTVRDEDGVAVCSAEVGAEGDWTCSGELKAGPQTVRAQATWTDLTSPDSEAVSFTVLENVSLTGGGCSATSGGSAPMSLLALLGLGLALRLRRREAER